MAVPPGKKVTAIKLYAKGPGSGRGTPCIMDYAGMCHSTEVFCLSVTGRAIEGEKQEKLTLIPGFILLQFNSGRESIFPHNF